MRGFIYNSWNSIMDHKINPLRHIQDLQVRHLVLQILAWMWCIAFSLYFSSFVVFGYTAVAHFILILAVVVTVVTFKKAENFKHHDGTLNYEKIQGKYEDIW